MMGFKVTEDERNAVKILVLQNNWQTRCAHKAAIALTAALQSGELESAQAKLARELIDANIENASLSGALGHVLVPLVERLEEAPESPLALVKEETNE